MQCSYDNDSSLPTLPQSRVSTETWPRLACSSASLVRKSWFRKGRRVRPFDFSSSRAALFAASLFCRMYSRTGIMAAFLHASLRSEPDSPSVRLTTVSRLKALSSGMSRSMRDRILLRCVWQPDRKTLGHPPQEGRVDVGRPVCCTENH